MTACSTSSKARTSTTASTSTTRTAPQTTLNLAGDPALDASGSNAVPLTTDLLFRDVNDAPVINLDPDNSGGGAADGNHAVVFTENGITVGSGPVRIADIDVGVTDADASALTSLRITASGLSDGAAEQVIFDGGGSAVREFALNASSSTTVTIGGVSWAIAYDTGTGQFDITRSSGGTFTTAQAQTLLATVLYNNTSEVPTSGGRSFAFTATDDAGATSAAATSVVSVTPANDRAWFNPDPDGSLATPGHASQYELVRLTAAGADYTGTLSDGGTVTISGDIRAINARAVSEPTTIAQYGAPVLASIINPDGPGTVTLAFPGGIAPEGTLIVLIDMDGRSSPFRSPAPTVRVRFSSRVWRPPSAQRRPSQSGVRSPVPRLASRSMRTSTRSSMSPV